MQQRRTPAWYAPFHLCKRDFGILNIQPGQIGMNVTLGYGGHSLEMLKCLVFGRHLYATDVNPFELPKTKDRLAALGYGEEVFTINKMNF